jgi:hypothetical protein
MDSKLYRTMTELLWLALLAVSNTGRSGKGGYGIRGSGERRAYIWGNTGVRLELSDGEVFLGHREPERIVHDLDFIKQSAY